MGNQLPQVNNSQANTPNKRTFDASRNEQVTDQKRKPIFGAKTKSNSKSENKFDEYISKPLLNQHLNYEGRINLSHPHFLKTIHKENGLIYFEKPKIPLQDMIKLRLPSNHFKESDLWALLKGILASLSYLQENSIAHGDIDSLSVYFDDSVGAFKIYDQELFAGKNSGFTLTKQMKKLSFISPELIPAFRHPQVNFINDTFFKSDIFALGMTILQAATLKSLHECYDIQTLSIKPEKIQELITLASAIYSNEFVNFVLQMINFNEHIRPDSISLYKQVSGMQTSRFQKESNGNIQNPKKEICHTERSETNVVNLNQNIVNQRQMNLNENLDKKPIYQTNYGQAINYQNQNFQIPPSQFTQQNQPQIQNPNPIAHQQPPQRLNNQCTSQPNYNFQEMKQCNYGYDNQVNPQQYANNPINLKGFQYQNPLNTGYNQGYQNICQAQNSTQLSQGNTQFQANNQTQFQYQRQVQLPINIPTTSPINQKRNYEQYNQSISSRQPIPKPAYSRDMSPSPNYNRKSIDFQSPKPQAVQIGRNNGQRAYSHYKPIQEKRSFERSIENINSFSQANTGFQQNQKQTSIQYNGFTKMNKISNQQLEYNQPKLNNPGQDKIMELNPPFTKLENRSTQYANGVPQNINHQRFSSNKVLNGQFANFENQNAKTEIAFKGTTLNEIANIQNYRSSSPYSRSSKFNYSKENLQLEADGNKFDMQNLSVFEERLNKTNMVHKSLEQRLEEVLNRSHEITKAIKNKNK